MAVVREEAVTAPHLRTLTIQCSDSITKPLSLGHAREKKLHEVHLICTHTDLFLLDAAVVADLLSVADNVRLSAWTGTCPPKPSPVHVVVPHMPEEVRVHGVTAVDWPHEEYGPESVGQALRMFRCGAAPRV